MLYVNIMCYNIFVKKIANFFKHVFVPHEGNDYTPHFLREGSIVFLCILALVVFSFSASTKFYIKKTNMTGAVLPAVLVDLTNSDRASSGLSGLTRNSVLDEAARLKAEDMAQNQYFAHNSPNGLTPWHFMDKAGYSFAYAGENLAVDFTESNDVENAWLLSPKHRANIMDARFTEIGIATVDAVFEGKNTTFVVQMFGKPMVKNDSLAENKTKDLEAKKDTKTVEPVKIALAPEVKGESIAVETKVEKVIENKEFAMVKNVEAIEEIPVSVADASSTPVEQNSSFFERLIFRSPYITDMVYRVLILVVLISLILMVFIEIKKQKPKNIAYGIIVLFLIVGLSYINKAIFMSTLLF